MPRLFEHHLGVVILDEVMAGTLRVPCVEGRTLLVIAHAILDSV
jgi:hypothetical protein